MVKIGKIPLVAECSFVATIDKLPIGRAGPLAQPLAHEHGYLRPPLTITEMLVKGIDAQRGDKELPRRGAGRAAG